MIRSICENLVFNTLVNDQPIKPSCQVLYVIDSSPPSDSSFENICLKILILILYQTYCLTMSSLIMHAFYIDGSVFRLIIILTFTKINFFIIIYVIGVIAKKYLPNVILYIFCVVTWYCFSLGFKLLKYYIFSEQRFAYHVIQ